MSSSFVHLLLLLCLTLIPGSLSFRRQSAGVTGRLFCGNEIASGVQVKLFDDDDGPDPDDLLGSAYTDRDGYFRMSGDTIELTPIDPELRIYHDCNDHGKPCQREWVIKLPNKYIYSGKAPPAQFMDIGTVNLEVELDGEGRSCLNH